MFQISVVDVAVLAYQVDTLLLRTRQDDPQGAGDITQRTVVEPNFDGPVNRLGTALLFREEKGLRFRPRLDVTEQLQPHPGLHLGTHVTRDDHLSDLVGATVDGPNQSVTQCCEQPRDHADNDDPGERQQSKRCSQPPAEGFQHFDYRFAHLPGRRATPGLWIRWIK